MVALGARTVGSTLQLGLETAVALAIGLAVGSVSAVRERLLSGATLAARIALRVGIAFLGARLTVGQLLGTGGASALAILVTVSIALVVGTLLARRYRVVPPLSALITVGMAICGNSAILALAPIIRAPHRETAYAVSTITIFGLIGVLVLPILGAGLGLTDATFGTWAGLAVNDTAQVVATGYAFSPAAGDVATVVKLTRNLAILPVLLAATWFAIRAERASGALAAGSGGFAPAAPAVAPVRLIARAVPWFVIGFVLLATLRSLGLLDGDVPTGGTLADLCSTLATALILVALAGVGISTDLRAMLAVGARPFLLGASIWILIATLAFLLAAALPADGGSVRVAAVAGYHGG